MENSCGLQFCSKAYALFEQNTPITEDAVTLAHAASDIEKKLIEELCQSASMYKPNMSGPYNLFFCSLVTGVNNSMPRSLKLGHMFTKCLAASGYLEATCVMHPNGLPSIESTRQKGGTFGPEGISSSQDPRN